MEALVIVKIMMLFTLLNMATCSKYCSKEFKKREYIPKYADRLKSSNLEVRYQKEPVKCGGKVSLIFERGYKAPTLKFDVEDKCENVTVIAFIPDNILNPPYVTWLVHNIPSSALKKGWTTTDFLSLGSDGNNQGDIIAPYDPPKIPQEDIGIGRKTIVFFVYCQCRYISDLRRINIIERIGQHFDVKSYASNHGLKNPVAGLFHESSVTGLKDLSI